MATFTDARVHMTDEQFEKLRSVIYERSGIHFGLEKKYILESRLGRRVLELEMADYDTYITFLTVGPYRDDEFQEMFNRITINETSFFRNEPQLQAFENQILPLILDRRAQNKRLRIWSAACSSGEEPFTLAMLVHRTLGVRLPDWRVEILGTDISAKALSIAHEGRYSEYAVRSTPELMLDRYFHREGKQYAIDESIRSMVTFEKHNLRDALAAYRHGLWDVIFCRNVLIYFDQDMKQSVAAMCERQLADDGALFIGHSETLRELDTEFELLPMPQAFCYMKAGASLTSALGG